ncbi:class I SAM-dependent methyltransferase, partial [Frankia sp. Cpl3]|nr:class I SAM-dependent methyltransferase [Frankia sp. Cpl3]
TYASRQADRSWQHFIRTLVPAEGKQVIDIGCGGGIYSKAWLELGTKAVTAVDFSAQMLADAAKNCEGLPQIIFKLGTATDTGLPDQCGDIVFERALIHHIDDLQACFTEAHRLL